MLCSWRAPNCSCVTDLLPCDPQPRLWHLHGLGPCFFDHQKVTTLLHD